MRIRLIKLILKLKNYLNLQIQLVVKNFLFCLNENIKNKKNKLIKFNFYS